MHIVFIGIYILLYIYMVIYGYIYMIIYMEITGGRTINIYTRWGVLPFAMAKLAQVTWFTFGFMEDIR